MDKADIHKLNLRLPVNLLEEVKWQAGQMGVSVNSYLLFAVSEQVKRVRRQLSKPAVVVPLVATSETTQQAKVGRNDLCPCGSGRKVKHCHPENC